MIHTLKRHVKHWPILTTVHAVWRARTQERDASVIKRRYELVARRRGLTPPEGPALHEALRRRLGVRPAQLAWPKKMGDLHVFLAYPLYNWEAVLPRMFAGFGRVTAFDWRSLGFDDSAADWLGRRDEMNRAMLGAFHAAAKCQPIDVVVGYASGYTVAPEVFLEMAAAGAVVANFCFDDKVHWPGALLGGRHASTAALAHAVDLNLTSDPNGLLKYAVHGGIAVFHPEAADPDTYRPLGVPFEYDVSFVGTRYGWRQALIEGLRRRGIDVACFGKGWKGGLATDTNGVYARSRINLGVGGIGYSRRLVCLKGRDFEVPMSGALYLTQHNPELSLVYDVGTEIVTFRDEADCARLIKELLADEQRAAAIRAAGRDRCLRDHTYAARWRNVLRTLGALE